MEQLPRPPSRQHKPGQPLDAPEKTETRAIAASLSASAILNNRSRSNSAASLSRNSLPVSQGQSSPPTPRNNPSNRNHQHNNSSLSIVASPTDSISPAATPSPFLHSLQAHTVRETNKARKFSVRGRKNINQYEVIEELGRGVHGKVKRALNSDTKEEVAIKIIPRFSKKRRLGKVTAKPEKDHKTMREIAILKKIRHPNVVALLEVIDDPELKKIYMVLEYVELGEICWRKKGLPHICAHERRRVERDMRSSSFSAEDLEYNQQRRQEHQGDLHQIQEEETRANNRAMYLGHHEFPEFFNYELAPEDDSSTSMSRNVSAHNFMFEPHNANSVPSSVVASRATSRAPSRNQSFSSLSRHFNGMHEGHITEESEPADTPVSPRRDHSFPAFLIEDQTFRARSDSMSESVLSHSSLDFNPLVTHDAFADDFSYVPCFTYDRARSTFRDTVLGLEYLHYQGVVHRDIKPANLLWTKDRRVKISDFGVSYFGRPIRDGEDDGTVSESEAMDFDDDRELSKTVGTPAFFAPELCYTDLDKEQYKVSEQIDIWSLGVTLYCLIYARIPFLAEDEFQMFKKIATEDVFIPTQRLAPVDPSTSPNTTSLYQRQNVAPYRDDNVLIYEDVDPNLRDLLQKMLIKDPEKRIRIREIKRHPWVTADIPDVQQWLDETDPAKPSLGRKIQVDEKELTAAVSTLSFMERVKKTITKIMHPLGGGERDTTKTRRRAPSSTASSCGDISRGHMFGSSASLQASAMPRDARRRSIRPDDATVHPLVNSITAETAEAPAMVYDPLATVLPEVSTPYHPGAPAMYHDHVREKSLEEPVRASDLRHSASLRSHRKSHSKSVANPMLERSGGSMRDVSLHRPVFDSGDDLVSMNTAPLPSDTPPVRSVSRSRARGISHSSIPSGRTQSPSTPSANTSATTPCSPLRGVHPTGHGRAMRSVDLSRGGHYSASLSPHGVNNFLRLTPVDTPRAEPSAATYRPDVHAAGEERPMTAHRVPSTQDTQFGIPDALPNQSLESQVSSAGSSSGEVYSPTTRTRASTGLSSTQSIVSSSCEPVGTPMSSPSDISSPVSSGNLASDGQCGGAINVSTFQSDPSLPALLSGASSVSADLDGEAFFSSKVDATSAIYRTTDSSTPPAMAKDRMDDFLDIQRSESFVPVQLDVETRPPHSPTSVSSHSHSHSHNQRLSISSQIHEPKQTQAVLSLADEDEDADDSDSDGGLTLPMRRRSRMPETHSRFPFPPRRRDTNASICSSDTAKKVDYS
ncbi:hypothetical protein TD95_004823 [Thielaviopsis punctulata]|uniref:non-specific serine/threonine protein kinase n=1 Tax=Thielaviopsis punctulata TaxID=72032 RepID=A0A0F4ZDZ8_9PEZI|nr:hypothetical protein TD95_004823 [Thielaviopsis punctulata]